jgi:hypothetical protein
MDRCGVYRCEGQATEQLVIHDENDDVLVEAKICGDHNAAVVAGELCFYEDPPGRIYIGENPWAK